MGCLGAKAAQRTSCSGEESGVRPDLEKDKRKYAEPRG